jgi:beta-lactamase class D
MKATRRAVLAFPFGALTAMAFARSSANAESLIRDDLLRHFEKHGLTGTFVLYDVDGDRMTLVNAQRAEERFVPASTFKIPNSVIALETGVVRDENEVIPYGGKPQLVKAWEKDMSMREALPVSNVPVYQELARRIGLERYRVWLDRLGYGNRELGTVVDRFWLDGPLKISAVEQVRFVARLAQGKLDASARAQSVVRDILRLEETGGATIYAKTGWAEEIGWWTGWVERDGKVFAFSLNMPLAKMEDAPKRIEIGKALLSELGVL